MPGKRDTGEFINPDVGFQHAIAYTHQQNIRIDELEEALLRLGKRLHQIQHGALTSMRECRYVSCRLVRTLLHQ